MKNKKYLLRIGLIISIILLIMSIVNKSYGVAIIAGAAIVGLLVEIAQVACVAVGLVGQLIITTCTQGGYSGAGGIGSVKDIIFNRSSLTTASYFANSGFRMGLTVWEQKGAFVNVFSNVTTFYYILRALSIGALLFILLYIGIRMAISTVASEEAKYKKMLGNWAVSMALVFLLQYIMIITLYVNNVLVEALYSFVDESNLGDYASLAVQGLVPVVGIGEAITFLMLIGIELTFLFMYIKRTITLGFLIVISPLITITYSIDKIGDGKSQALNAWLKEFIFTVLIQPFHCIIYIVIVQTALKGMADWFEPTGSWVIYILMLKFMKEAEGIVRKIFGIQSDSMPGHASMGAMALGVMTQVGNIGGKRSQRRKRWRKGFF